ncbi:MAG: hypothetical protein DI640_04025 [Sphingomonas taxi]|uniref:Uncharacterized protein n=1 Tax=Sphingomonas taxi TaxID=1549858 RepID=A0A2W4Z0W8_9SPHN|nr:MAG: hypothetical protein DI640_04025 [Sphingomonas taxi]
MACGSMMVRELLICVIGQHLQQIIRSARTLVAIKYYVETTVICFEACLPAIILKIATGADPPAL